MPRQNTKLESEGAEFLVLGHLLLNRILSYKTYTNMPGYDLVATNPDKNTAAKIQVKSRWRTGAPMFLIKNFNCDFVVVVLLNRGRKGGGGKVLPPEFLVFPTIVVKRACRTDITWSKVVFRDIENHQQYRDAWKQIADFLKKRTSLAGRLTS
jgi:hypothetical protein